MQNTLGPTESVASSEQRNSTKIHKHQSSGLLCFGLPNPKVKFGYKHFIRQIITFKNAGGFTPNTDSSSESDMECPPLEEIYLLICSDEQAKDAEGDRKSIEHEGIIRAFNNPKHLNQNNLTMSSGGQLYAEAGEADSKADCDYSIPIGAIKRGAQAATGLEERSATIIIHPYTGVILVVNE